MNNTALKIHVYPYVLALTEILHRKKKNKYAPYNMSHVTRKPVFGVSDHVGHKPACAATDDGQKLENSDLGRRGIN